MERPRWAVLFGGKQYIVFLLAYFGDKDKYLRPALFCSPVMHVDDVGLPITTATLYMMLSSNTHIHQEQLLEKLAIPIPTSPAPLLSLHQPPSPAATTSESLQAVLNCFKVFCFIDLIHRGMVSLFKLQEQNILP